MADGFQCCAHRLMRRMSCSRSSRKLAEAFLGLDGGLESEGLADNGRDRSKGARGGGCETQSASAHRWFGTCLAGSTHANHTQATQFIPVLLIFHLSRCYPCKALLSDSVWYIDRMCHMHGRRPYKIPIYIKLYISRDASTHALRWRGWSAWSGHPSHPARRSRNEEQQQTVRACNIMYPTGTQSKAPP